MKKWHVISGGKSFECDFVSINTAKAFLYLSYNKQTFKIVFDDINAFEKAKDGNEVFCTRTTRNVKKQIKIIFR